MILLRDNDRLCDDFEYAGLIKLKSSVLSGQELLRNFRHVNYNQALALSTISSNSPSSSSISARKRSASNAAMQPVPAAVTACR